MMDRDTLYARMTRLHELIIQEREAAKDLDVEKLASVAEEKEALVQILGTVEEPDEDLQALAEAIRNENRRNAYLFWSGLTWVRETMNFFGSQVPVPAYGSQGTNVQSKQGGKLLSGRI